MCGCTLRGNTADAALHLGYCYEEGTGCEQDLDKAREFYRAAKYTIGRRSSEILSIYRDIKAALERVGLQEDDKEFSISDMPGYPKKRKKLRLQSGKTLEERLAQGKRDGWHKSAVMTLCVNMPREEGLGCCCRTWYLQDGSAAMLEFGHQMKQTLMKDQEGKITKAVKKD